MLHVSAILKPSPIHGMGLFAAQPIKAGELVWRYNPILDFSTSEDDMSELPDCQKSFLRKHCYINPDYPNILKICGDLAMFMNFSERANLVFGEKMFGEYDLVADRDIAEGEELTVFPESDFDYARKLSS